MAEGILKQFDYYYGLQAESFNFIQVPRFLFTSPEFRSIKSDSKILYSLMLDRMSLSRKNGWLDEENRVYIIYTLEEMMDSIGCGHTKCVELMKELSTFGLIERKKRGLGKPDIIYVKDFLHAIEEPSNPDKYTDFRKTEGKTSAEKSDFQNTESKTSEKRNSGLPENGTQDFRKSESSKTNINNNYNNQTDLSYLPLLLCQQEENGRRRAEEEEEKIKKQIDYDRLVRMHQGNLDLLAFILKQMTDMMLETKNRTELSMNRYEDSRVVKGKLSQITFDDIENLLHKLPDKKDSQIKNETGYLRTCLFNLVDRRGAICATEQIKGNKIGGEYNFKALMEDI